MPLLSKRRDALVPSISVLLPLLSQWEGGGGATTTPPLIDPPPEGPNPQGGQLGGGSIRGGGVVLLKMGVLLDDPSTHNIILCLLVSIIALHHVLNSMFTSGASMAKGCVVKLGFFVF